MKKKAIITGICGQDGSYLAEILIEKQYDVYGFDLCQDIKKTYLKNLANQINYFVIDILSLDQIRKTIMEIQPDEIYNFAAQSNSVISWDKADYTFQANLMTVINIIDCIKELKNGCKLFQASSSELFGNNPVDCPQSEKTILNPYTPYAIAKAAAHQAIGAYRDKFGLFLTSGIFYNHESERRGGNFLTSKVISTVAKIGIGKEMVLEIGNLDSLRDWGYAPDYMKAAWMILQENIADDYVIATGKLHSVREFIENAFKTIDINVVWKGIGIDELGINEENEKIIVRVNKEFYRENDTCSYVGNNDKLIRITGWIPRISFSEMIDKMVNNYMNILKET